MDIALKYNDGVIDLDFGDGGNAIDDTLRTAVIISLFTDRRADDDDTLPDGSNDRRGWWGDTYPDVDGDLTGSRIWLLSRSKQIPDVLRHAETYAKEALQWMIDDGVASFIEAIAENPFNSVMMLSIHITRPNGDVIGYTFKSFWEAEYAL